MSSRSLIAAVAVASVATLSLFSVGAQAQTKVTVPLAKYNLSKQADAQELYVRLRRASEAACRSHDTGELSRKRIYEACVDETLANAVADVDDARLSAVHESDSSMRIAARTERSRT